jgi:hypothetical protein
MSVNETLYFRGHKDIYMFLFPIYSKNAIYSKNMKDAESYSKFQKRSNNKRFINKLHAYSDSILKRLRMGGKVFKGSFVSIATLLSSE